MSTSIIPTPTLELVGFEDEELGFFPTITTSLFSYNLLSSSLSQLSHKEFLGVIIKGIK